MARRGVYITRAVRRMNRSRSLFLWSMLGGVAVSVACRGSAPGETPIDAGDPSGMYAPAVVNAIDRMSHDDARCTRGWISRAIDAAQGRVVTPRPEASTLAAAAQQAMQQRWCLLDPAPDIAKQLTGCINLSQSPTEEHACHCQLLRPHLAFLSAAAGDRTKRPQLTKAVLEACISSQAFVARCQLAAGTLAAATACEDPGSN